MYSIISIVGLTFYVLVSIAALNSEKINTISRVIIYSGLVLFLIALIKYVWDIVYGIYSFTFYINEEGVEFRKRKEIYHLSWDEVHSIFIYPNRYGRLNKSSMICFIGSDKYPLRLRDVRQFNETFIGVQFREKIIHEIRKYWDQPIQGIYQIVGKTM